MASADDKKLLLKLARKGKMEGDDGFKYKLTELTKMGITGPGHDYGLDWSDKPFYRPALWEATWKNHETIVRLLIEKNATVDFADYQGRTPLHEAAYYGYQNLVELLLASGHPIDPKDNFGQTPLFRATEAGRDSVVEMLASRQADLNLLDSDGVTLQHVAAFSGEPYMSNYLLYKGAWKNRFSMEHAAPQVENKASAKNAQALISPKAAATAEELESAEASPEQQEEAKEEAAPPERTAAAAERPPKAAPPPAEKREAAKSTPGSMYTDG